MIRVAGFSKESITDGTGIRYVVFTQGASMDALDAITQTPMI